MSEEVKVGPNKEGKYTTENKALKNWLIAAPLLTGAVTILTALQGHLEQWPTVALVVGVLVAVLAGTSKVLGDYFAGRSTVKASENHKLAAEAMLESEKLKVGK